MPSSNKVAHLLELTDHPIEVYLEIFKIAKSLKEKPIQPFLKDKTFGLIFSKSSTRTRVSFEVGIGQLGGKSLFLSPQDIQLGRGESLDDTAKVLSRYLDGVVIRTYAQKDLVTFAQHATIPVINGLTDLAHPCQVLADIFTIQEKLGSYKGKKVVFFGDCQNNMAYSWILSTTLFGFELVLTGHPKYKPNEALIEKAHKCAVQIGGSVTYVENPVEASTGANVLYTDVWASMGQEEESDARQKELHPWQVDQDKVALADPNVIFMHCLPAHRGEEVSAEIMAAPCSVVFDQAENRLHIQKGILTYLCR